MCGLTPIRMENYENVFKALESVKSRSINQTTQTDRGKIVIMLYLQPVTNTQKVNYTNTIKL